MPGPEQTLKQSINQKYYYEVTIVIITAIKLCLLSAHETHEWAGILALVLDSLSYSCIGTNLMVC